MRGTSPAVTPVRGADFTQTIHNCYDANADIAIGVYRTLVNVSGSGYVAELNLEVYIETPGRTELIFEIDGTQKPPFEIHGSGLGITSQIMRLGPNAGRYICEKKPFWRFESSFKIQVYGNHATASMIGLIGTAEVWTE